MRRPVYAMAFMAVLATSGCKSDDSAATDAGKSASDEAIISPGCVSDAVCASSVKDCEAGERCNASFNPPRCQKLYCGALGTSCRAVSGSGDRADDFCASRHCIDDKCAAPIAPGAVAFGCDVKDGGAHVCTDYSLSFGTDILKSTCTSRGGTVVEQCDRAGAVGGCRFSVTLDAGAQAVITQWTYGGDISMSQSTCTAASGVWVSPSA